MILLIVTCLILLICELYTLKLYRKYKFEETNDYHEITSFKKVMSKTGMIYLTFTCQGKELNFILDTGSTISYIEESAVIDLNIKRKPCNEISIGLGGNNAMTEYANLILETPTTITSIDMPLSNFSRAFEGFDVEIHGLLGNNFLEASKYIIDYEKMKIFKPKAKK